MARRGAKVCWQPLSDLEVLELLEEGVYRVDLAAGTVSNRDGLVLKSRRSLHKDATTHQFVYLFCNGNRRKAIALHKLVWMAATRKLVPPGFEVHHRDECPENNAWTNLYLLYWLDHQKLHGNDLLAAADEAKELF